MSTVDNKNETDKVVANANNLVIGVIGDESSGKSSVCTTLSMPEHVKTQFSFRKNKYIGTRFGRNNAMIIDIECASERYSNAINAIADCDAIIYVVSCIKTDDDKSERLMRRYLEIAHIFRVKHFIVAITKIDYQSITEKIFERATNRVKDIMHKTNIEEYDIVPVAEENEDIEFITNCPNMKWYDGPTVTDKLSDVKPLREYKEDPFLLTVTHFYKNSGVIVGKVRRGMVSVGERIKVFPSGIKGQIASLQTHSESVDTAHCGDDIGIKLKMKNKNELSIKRGDIMQIDDVPDQREPLPAVAFRFSGTIHIQKTRDLMKDLEKRLSVRSIPRLTLQSDQNTTGTDEHKSEYIAVVTFGSVKVGDELKLQAMGSDRWGGGVIKSIKKIISESKEEDVPEAKCGDTIRLQTSYPMEVRSWKYSMLTGEDGRQYYRYPLAPVQLQRGDRLNTPHAKPRILRIYPKTAETERHFIFNIFIGNGTAECYIHSIKWKKSANGKRIQNPEYLEQGDTAEVILEALQPIHVTPYDEYPEFSAFVMVYNHSNMIAQSFVVGKVTKIIETTTLKAVYPKFKDHENNLFCRRSKQIIKDTLDILQTNIGLTRCGCGDRLNEMRGDYHLMAVSKMKPSYSLRSWSERNLCMAQQDVMITCGLSRIKHHKVVLSLCNEMDRMLKKMIPMEVVQIIKLNCSQIRKAFRKDSSSGACKWIPIKELVERDICKMVQVHRSSSGRPDHRRTVSIRRLYLEENGTLWEEEWPHRYLSIQQYFVKNNIVIKDVAIGGMTTQHCLAVDDHHRVYSWGSSHDNMFGQCGLGHALEVTTPTLITFPFSDNEVVAKCVAIKCGASHSYVCLRVKKQDKMGREYAVDKHFMFGYNVKNECLTFDERNRVQTPFCINETVKAHYGGEIDGVFFECSDHYGGGDATCIVMKKYYQFA